MAGGQWYMAIGGHQVGPVSEDEIRGNLQNGTIDAGTLLFTAGMSNWAPLSTVPQFAGIRERSRRPHLRQPPGSARARQAHDIDFKIYGEDMQFVEVELDPGESAVAEAGSLMYMTPGIQMETVFGDGSQQQGSGIVNALLGAGRRILTGESLFMTVFTNQGTGQASPRVRGAVCRAHRAHRPRRARRHAHLPEGFVPLRGARRVDRDCVPEEDRRRACSAAKGSSCSACRATACASSMRAAWCTRSSSRPGETLRVDTGCLVALYPTVQYDIQFVGKVKTALFGGEGLFFATLTGPARCGCSRCRSAVWRTASTRRRRRQATAAKRARCSTRRSDSAT